MKYMIMMFRCDGCGKEEKGFQTVDGPWVPPVGWSNALDRDWCPECSVDAEKVAQTVDNSMHEHTQVAQTALSDFVSKKSRGG